MNNLEFMKQHGRGLDQSGQRSPDLFSRDKIELRLRLHLINYQQACSGTREGDIRIAKNALIDQVEKLVGEARAGGVGS